MKVAPKSNTEQDLTKKVDQQSSRNEIDSRSAGDFSAAGLSDKSSFANVLDRVTKSRDKSSSQKDEQQSSSAAETNDKKRSVEDQSDATTVGSGSNLSTESTAHIAAETPIETNSILHVMDLEKIVEACRVQVTPGGKTEVILDLSRSMLEGLRVKVGTDASGRISAEFLAANEGIRSLLDSRSSDLIALLRSRGIELSEFKSSVAADSNRGNSNPEGQDHRQVARTSGSDTSTGSVLSSEEADTSEITGGSTYRA